MQEKGPCDVPGHGRQEEGLPSATGSQEGVVGNYAFDTRPRHKVVDALILNQELGRVSDGAPGGCVESLASDGRRIAHTHPSEPMLATPLFGKVASAEPIVNSDVCCLMDELSKSGSCAEEVDAQAAEALLLSEFGTEGTLAVDETELDAGIGVQDWLDVTHAMLESSGLEVDLG